jgi:hypothetical protein
VTSVSAQDFQLFKLTWDEVAKTILRKDVDERSHAREWCFQLMRDSRDYLALDLVYSFNVPSVRGH